MRRWRVFTKRQAEEDANEIWFYIAQDNPQAAETFLSAVEEASYILSTTPVIGALRYFYHAELHGLRFYPLKKFEKYPLFYERTEPSHLTMGRFDALTQLDEKQEKTTPKNLNSDANLNDLKGPVVNRLDGSAFLPAKNHSPSPLSENPIIQEEQFNQSTPKLSNARTPVPRPVRGTVPPTVPLIPKVKHVPGSRARQQQRLIKQRQPFDIYEDQYERLKQIAGSEREFINGRGMSQMVREAIDNYLRDHCSSKE